MLFSTKLAIFYDESKLHVDDDDLLDQHAELDCYSASCHDIAEIFLKVALNTLNL